MDAGDLDRFWCLHVLARFAYYRYVEGRNHLAALNAVRDYDEDGLVEPMIARSITVGNIPGVEVMDVFIYRAELYLIGLHDDLVRGISLGRTADGLEVAACLVAVFPLHDYFVHDEDDEDIYFIYGGEGGQLAAAHQHHIRVLHNQQWSRRNLALRNSAVEETPLRLIVAQLLQDGSRTYTYLGLFACVFWEVVESNEGFYVLEFLLEPW